jgi:hypothetical protein
MSIFSKLAFWKKDDDNLGLDSLGLDNSQSAQTGLDFPADNFSMQNQHTQQNFNPNFGNQPQSFNPGNQGFNPSNVANQQTTNNFNANAYGPQYAADSYNAASPYPKNFEQRPYDQNTLVSKDIEIISSKLDALRATLDSLNQRIINIEHIIREERDKKYKW